MKYKIMRMYHNMDQIFLDLYNDVYNVNIELKFCCYSRSYEYKTLINWLVYCNSVKQDVTPQEIIKQYEDISFANKGGRKNGV